MLASESQLALWTKRDRKTIRSKLIDVPFQEGVSKAKMYESHIALGVLYGVGAEYKKGIITPQEAARLLTVKRTEEIELNMQVVRKKRIPLDEAEEANDMVLQNVAGILKASENKKLTPELVQEIFAELRRMDEHLKKFARNAPVDETPEEVKDILADDPLFN
jgi:DNA transposition AAA+ family ATPase